MSKTAITLTINGEDHGIAVEPRRTLADAIREDCGQTGTHIGCEHGVCGACTVLVDDVPLYACSILTHAARERAISTVEGLEGPNGELHPVQAAFVSELGPQCGFCTPGQVMSAVGLLLANPRPTVEEDAARPRARHRRLRGARDGGRG
jgi:aerobic-type carbon monoxide dehydrogenase small subunit (CoxS/CutS family)